jgi:hypothetical protein
VIQVRRCAYFLFLIRICGAAESCKARAMNNVPVWRYLQANAGTGSDLSAVQGNGVAGSSKLFQSSWATFVKDPVNGLSKLGWPKYDPTGKKPIRNAF